MNEGNYLKLINQVGVIIFKILFLFIPQLKIFKGKNLFGDLASQSQAKWYDIGPNALPGWNLVRF